MPKERILSAMVLIPLVMAAVYVGGPVLAGGVAVVAGGALWGIRPAGADVGGAAFGAAHGGL